MWGPPPQQHLQTSLGTWQASGEHFRNAGGGCQGSCPQQLLLLTTLLTGRSLRLSSGTEFSKKYPLIKASYESKGSRGLFILGTASHSVDYRKSAGGFIHGFRYTGKSDFQKHRKDILMVWRSPRGSMTVDTSKGGCDMLSPMQLN